MNEKIKSVEAGHTFGPSAREAGKTGSRTAPVAREASELGEAAELSGGGDNVIHRHWNWTIPGGNISVTVNYEKGTIDLKDLNEFAPLTTLEYMVEDFIDESLEFLGDSIIDLQRHRRKNG